MWKKCSYVGGKFDVFFKEFIIEIESFVKKNLF